MTDRFETCHAITAAWEGGWSDHPADPGGKTMYGITETRWHECQDKMGWKRTPVRNVTKAQALVFYRSEFWKACGADTLYPGVDLSVYDASVNSGVSRGRKWLLASVGSNDHSQTVKKICRARLSFMQSLAIWKTFGKGWGRRVADIEVKGVAMALAAMGATENRIQSIAKDEAAAARKSSATADRVTKSAAAGSVASGGAPIIDPAAPDWMAIAVLTALCLALAAGAVLFFIRKRAADARAEAYEGAAT